MSKPKVPPPLYFLLGILLIVLIYALWPATRIIVFPFNLSGLVLLVWGFVLLIQAHQAFARRKTPENFERPTNLVTDGPYRYSRNPQYLAALLMLVGLAIVLQNPVALIAPFVFYFIMQFAFVRSEEAYLRRRFGDKYKKYKNKTRSWL